MHSSTMRTTCPLTVLACSLLPGGGGGVGDPVQGVVVLSWGEGVGGPVQGGGCCQKGVILSGGLVVLSGGEGDVLPPRQTTFPP